MTTVLIPWTTGQGNIVLEGEGGDIRVSSDTPNYDGDRQQVLTFRTDVGNKTATLTVVQKGADVIILRDSDNKELRESSGQTLTVTKEV